MRWIVTLVLLVGLAGGALMFVLTATDVGPVGTLERPVATMSAPVPKSDRERDTPDALVVEDEASRVIDTSPDEVESPAPTPADEALGAILAGAIVDTSGAVVDAEGVLFVIDDAGRTERVGAHRTYSHAGVAPGRWFIRTWGFDGYTRATDEVVVEPGVALTRHDIVLERTATFDVLAFTPDGEPLEAGLPLFSKLGAVAHVDAPPAVLEPSVSRVADSGVGRFLEHFAWSRESKPAGTIGTLSLEEPLPVFVSLTFSNRVLATQRVTDDVSEVRFVVAPTALEALFGEVAVRVADSESGAPISGASVDLHHLQTTGGGSGVEDDGMYLFTRQRPGALILDASADGYEQRSERILVVPGERVDVEVALSPTVPLRGELRIDGVPGVGRIGHVLVDDGVADFRRGARATRSADDGSFEIRRLGRHVYLLSARVDGYPPALREVDLRGGEVPPVVLDVRSGVDVVFTSADGWPEPADVSIVGPSGHALHEFRGWSGLPPQRCMLVPGAYTARVEHADGTFTTHDFDVPARGESRIVLP